ncbi:MAG: type II toxin-antitoxin system PemK/MazF family toxin [Pseudomonadota bacterium]|nr:type II toxin-antitoxin system PemK/MazF family toxin [Pseudomonadota bacterium]
MARPYVPQRNDIVWLDFEPKKGKEIGKYRPALVLSSRAYNKQTGLMICCPISTSIRNSGTEVPINNLEQPCVVAANIIHTVDWRERKVKLAAQAESGVMIEVLLRVIPLIGADAVIAALIEKG